MCAGIESIRADVIAFLVILSVLSTVFFFPRPEGVDSGAGGERFSFVGISGHFWCIGVTEVTIVGYGKLCIKFRNH